MSELGALKAAASAKGYGEFIVAWTDTAPMSDPKRSGPAYVRPELTFEVGGRKYAVGKDRAFGVLFAPVDP